jgi:hypothetical protein
MRQLGGKSELVIGLIYLLNLNTYRPTLKKAFE